jgi:FkbM family methyltransferase
VRVLDLGAHVSLFGAYALSRWPEASITSYEPDPGNARLLAATIAANDRHGRWRLVRAAVSNASGTLPFAAGLSSEARASGPEDLRAIEVACLDLLAEDTRPTSSRWTSRAASGRS